MSRSMKYVLFLSKISEDTYNYFAEISRVLQAVAALLVCSDRVPDMLRELWR